MHVVVTILALASLVAQGGPSGVHVWKKTEILAKGTSLAQKLNEQKVASEVIATEGNRTFSVAHREGSGVAEWHEKQADIMMISVGEVTMVYGGTIVDGKTTQPGEIRGPSIRGGTEVTLGPGDVDYTAGGVWGPDDRITFGRGNVLWQVSASGGQPIQLTTLDTGKASCSTRSPRSLWGSQRLVAVWNGDVWLEGTEGTSSL